MTFVDLQVSTFVSVTLKKKGKKQELCDLCREVDVSIICKGRVLAAYSA